MIKYWTELKLWRVFSIYICEFVEINEKLPRRELRRRNARHPRFSSIPQNLSSYNGPKYIS